MIILNYPLPYNKKKSSAWNMKARYSEITEKNSEFITQIWKVRTDNSICIRAPAHLLKVLKNYIDYQILWCFIGENSLALQ